jgi:hypothetical protein
MYQLKVREDALIALIPHIAKLPIAKKKMMASVIRHP